MLYTPRQGNRRSSGRFNDPFPAVQLPLPPQAEASLFNLPNLVLEQIDPPGLFRLVQVAGGEFFPHLTEFPVNALVFPQLAIQEAEPIHKADVFVRCHQLVGILLAMDVDEASPNSPQQGRCSRASSDFTAAFAVQPDLPGGSRPPSSSGNPNSSARAKTRGGRPVNRAKPGPFLPGPDVISLEVRSPSTALMEWIRTLCPHRFRR